MGNDKDLVWLPKNLCDEIKKVQDPFSDECRSLINKYIEETKEDYKRSLESLDEDVLMYRGLMIKAKKSFEDAKKEHLMASYDLWEKFEQDMPRVNERVEKMLSALKPLGCELDKINKAIQKIQTWNIEKLLELLSTISSILSSENDTSKIMKFLVSEYKNDNE